MVGVGAGYRKWVIENTRSLRKRNPMLAEVFRRLDSVPLKTHAPILSLKSAKVYPTRVAHPDLKIARWRIHRVLCDVCVSCGAKTLLALDFDEEDGDLGFVADFGDGGAVDQVG